MIYVRYLLFLALSAQLVFVVGHKSQALSVNVLTKRLYVANSGNNTVSVIDYFISQSGDFKSTNSRYPSGKLPMKLGINWYTYRLYVVNSAIDGTLSVIDQQIKK